MEGSLEVDHLASCHPSFHRLLYGWDDFVRTRPLLAFDRQAAGIQRYQDAIAECWSIWCRIRWLVYFVYLCLNDTALDCVVTLLSAYYSDRYNSRAIPTAIVSCLAIIGYSIFLRMYLFSTFVWLHFSFARHRRDE